MCCQLVWFCLGSCMGWGVRLRDGGLRLWNRIEKCCCYRNLDWMFSFYTVGYHHWNPWELGSDRGHVVAYGWQPTEKPRSGSDVDQLLTHATYTPHEHAHTNGGSSNSCSGKKPAFIFAKNKAGYPSRMRIGRDSDKKTDQAFGQGQKCKNRL